MSPVEAALMAAWIVGWSPGTLRVAAELWIPGTAIARAIRNGICLLCLLWGLMLLSGVKWLVVLVVKVWCWGVGRIAARNLLLAGGP